MNLIGCDGLSTYILHHLNDTNQYNIADFTVMTNRDFKFITLYSIDSIMNDLQPRWSIKPPDDTNGCSNKKPCNSFKVYTLQKAWVRNFNSSIIKPNDKKQS